MSLATSSPPPAAPAAMAAAAPLPTSADFPSPSPPGETSVLPFAAWTLAAMVVLLLFLPLLSPLWTGGPPRPSTPAGPAAETFAGWRLSLRGIGAVKVGMTPARAARALGRPLRPSSRFLASRACAYLEPEGGPENIYFMVVAGRIARVDVLNPRVATPGGARIGLPESQLLALYPGRIRVEPHRAGQRGKDLVYTSRGAADRNYSMVFETDGEIVTALRAGRRREVGTRDHCR